MNTTQAASNIMHEISHNILSEALTEDEQFVSDLENAIMNNQMTKELLFALNEGNYVKDGVIYIDQLIDIAGREDVLKKSMTSYFDVQEKYEALDVSQFTQIYGRKFLTFMKSKGWHPGLRHCIFPRKNQDSIWIAP